MISRKWSEGKASPCRVGEVINKHQASETSEPPCSGETLHERAGRWHFLKQKHIHTHSHTPNYTHSNQPTCPAVSQICALMTFPSPVLMLLVANSTPIVLLLSRLNSLRVNRDKRLDFPTPESPMRTTARGRIRKRDK